MLSQTTSSKLLEGIAEISKAIMEQSYIDDLLSLIVTVTAKEIIMDKRGISGKPAFELMRRQSMNSRISMVKIAESIILASAFD